MACNGTVSIAFIEDRMTATKYVDVLRDNLPLSASLLGLSAAYYFQQDNDPKHTTWGTRLWLLYNVHRRINTPPQSPDINPIENVWYILDLQVRKRHLKNVT